MDDQHPCDLVMQVPVDILALTARMKEEQDRPAKRDSNQKHDLLAAEAASHRRPWYSGFVASAAPVFHGPTSATARRPESPLVADAEGDAVGVIALEQQLRDAARDAERVPEAGERDR